MRIRTQSHEKKIPHNILLPIILQIAWTWNSIYFINMNIVLLIAVVFITQIVLTLNFRMVTHTFAIMLEFFDQESSKKSIAYSLFLKFL